MDCVDILELAVLKLNQYAQEYGVEKMIRGVVSSIDHYIIPRREYDLILAVSALEHVCSAVMLQEKMMEIRQGLRPGGVACLIVNTNIIERDKETGEQLLPQFEVNLSTVQLDQLVREEFRGCQVLVHKVTHQRYELLRGSGTAELESAVVTWVIKESRDIIPKTLF